MGDIEQRLDEDICYCKSVVYGSVEDIEKSLEEVKKAKTNYTKACAIANLFDDVRFMRERANELLQLEKIKSGDIDG